MIKTISGLARRGGTPGKGFDRQNALADIHRHIYTVSRTKAEIPFMIKTIVANILGQVNSSWLRNNPAAAAKFIREAAATTKYAEVGKKMRECMGSKYELTRNIVGRVANAALEMPGDKGHLIFRHLLNQ
jgi:hypothetical protein